MKSVLSILLLMMVGFVLVKPVQGQILDSPPRNSVYEKIHSQDKQPVAYPFVREADVIWSKRIWRQVDMKEKMNQAFYYPREAHNDWRSFATVIVDALKEGTITAYDASVTTDEFTVPLTYQELIGKLEKADTMVMQRPYPPYESFDTVITTPFNSADISKFRIKEDWIFDKQRSVMEARILGVCLVKENYTEDGILRGDEPLFWIYFPEARKVLAKAQVFNRGNGAVRLSYDDVFWKRMFSSKIIKEENVYDRGIAQYAKGLDALLESERIRNELFDFEHNLWEY